MGVDISHYRGYLGNCPLKWENPCKTRTLRSRHHPLTSPPILSAAARTFPIHSVESSPYA